jgi:hypothetical protein
MTALTTKLSVKYFKRNNNFIGREREECGKIKPVVTNPCRGSRDTFEKLKTNAIGDPYVDRGQYYLRKSTSNVRPKTAGAPFMPSGGPRTIRNSEF